MRVCRTLSPRPDSLSIRSHAREVETLTLSQHMPRPNSHTPGKDTLLIFAVSSYLQCLSMCSKQGKPSVPVHLTLMPSSSVGRNSDPFLGLPVLVEHSTSAWHKCQPKKCHQTFVLRYNEFGHVFEGKSSSKWWLTFLPTPNPYRMRIGRFSAVPSCSLIN